MSLTSADFAGFDAIVLQRYLQSFSHTARKRGESYFQRAAVTSLDCEEPGRAFTATVQGSEPYDVDFFRKDGWDALCSCPVGIHCKHIYATGKQLLAEHAAVAVAALSEQARHASGIPKMTVPAARARNPAGFADQVRHEIGRKLTPDEEKYLKTITRLHNVATNGGLYYSHELTGLGLPAPSNYWERLDMYPSRPDSAQEFWNYLALHITEKLHRSIPAFLEPFTDLARARERIRKHQRAQEIERWKHTLENGQQMVSGVPGAEAGGDPGSVELRVCFEQDKLRLEWRKHGGNWSEVKASKIRDFDSEYAPDLVPEAALIWLPWLHRLQTGYSTKLTYQDQWTLEQIGRWFLQPVLRPMLVNAQGEPLVFHEAPVHWSVVQPEDEDGDYTFSLVRADGTPLPETWLAVGTHYLTPAGVFTGPPINPLVTSFDNATRIPARAFESAGGVRLLENLRVEPPPRLAARIRTVSLLPGIRAELKVPWAGVAEQCRLEVYGASGDGEHIEHWVGNGWVNRDGHSTDKKRGMFVSVDRSLLGALLPPLARAGFKWDFQNQQWQLRLSKAFAETFSTFLKELPAGTRIDLAGDLASFQNAEVAGKIRLEASEDGMDWFNLRVLVDVNDATLTREEIKLLLDAKGKWVRLDKKGWRRLEFSLSEDEDRELARLGLTPHELTSEPQRLHALQLADKASRKFLPAETCERIERRATELQARVTPDVPGEIQAEMRPYQRDGFHFLCYLSANHFGGILADDMGLGKTLQTLAWLAWLRGQAPDSQSSEHQPSLVVCPKSVADNWRAEAEKFFPSLKVRVWSAGDLKSLAGMLASADLHVLNYSQLRTVSEDLLRERFHAVILDEGQYIKNPSSITAQVARQLRAEHRLILSGTPIENRLLDLWSLMNFAMPGVLNNRASFGRLYDAKNDPFARQRLSARVRPFLIRRTKAQVARDLPDRVEEDLFCELEGEQKTLYRAELKRAQAMLLGIKTAAALNKQRFNFLTSLLRLRQICCHPKLVKPGSKAASAKVEALIETIEPLIEEGEKVLVFSQFVELLDILRGELNKRGWKHWHLAGDTENRGELVKEFQSAEGAGVFLISLKAGGFGLNLTAASYVVLFDPWWNPAVENQAIDRTHRIGQDRKVIAYRLLIKDSIEEKIRALQRRKKSLAEDVLGEEKFSQSLSLDDLRFLLEG